MRSRDRWVSDETSFLRSDSNGDGASDISDASHLERAVPWDRNIACRKAPMQTIRSRRYLRRHVHAELKFLEDQRRHSPTGMRG